MTGPGPANELIREELHIPGDVGDELLVGGGVSGSPRQFGQLFHAAVAFSVELVIGPSMELGDGIGRPL